MAPQVGSYAAPCSHGHAGTDCPGTKFPHVLSNCTGSHPPKDTTSPAKIQIWLKSLLKNTVEAMIFFDGCTLFCWWPSRLFAMATHKEVAKPRVFCGCIHRFPRFPRKRTKNFHQETAFCTSVEAEWGRGGDSQTDNSDT